MLPALTTLLLLQARFSLALSLQLGSVLPRLVNDISSQIFSHSDYVDQKVHQNPRSFLNHEQWHQRHVVAFTNCSSVAYVTVSAPTGFLGTIGLGSAPAKSTGTASLGPALSSALTFQKQSSTTSLGLSLSSASATVLQAYSPKDSTSTTSLTLSLSSASAASLQEPSLASLLGPIEDLQTDKSANWDDHTESACSAALIALHGVATNPSGIAACYNIQSLDTLTGIFEVDLRLYRISAPTEGWLRLDPSSVGVGLTYTNATVSATKAKRAKREDRTLPWFPAQKDEAADIYIRRSTGAPPRRLESMTFVGNVDDGPLAELKNMTTALSLLTPAITLAGTEQDGTSISTRFSTQDASFVNGVFADTGSKGSQSTTATDAGGFILPGTKLAGFPVGLIISSIWAILYLMTMGYGTISRYQARESYRRRVKHRFSGDGITKRKMRWA